jgi:hypothetical protein
MNFAVLYDTNSDAPDVHFNTLYLSSDSQADKIGNPKCYYVKYPYKNHPNRVS